MDQATVLIISNDAEFSHAIIARWKFERNVPAFSLMSADLCPALDSEGFDVAIVGGLGTAFGPLVGVLVIYPITELVASVFSYVNIAIGLILIVVALYFPKGIVGSLSDLRRATRDSADDIGLGIPAEVDAGIKHEI